MSEFDQELPPQVCSNDDSLIKLNYFEPRLTIRLINCGKSSVLILTILQFSLIWPVLLPYVGQLVNLSMKSGVFPSSYKESHITPFIKSPILVSNFVQSYRPAFNLFAPISCAYCGYRDSEEGMRSSKQKHQTCRTHEKVSPAPSISA